MTFEAVVLTIGEPQTEECIKALKEQFVPFDKISVLENVSPYSEAHNQGMEQSTCDWSLFVDADMILNQGAITLFKSKMRATNDIYAYAYRLWDSFLETKIKGVKLFNTKIAKSFPYRNSLASDRISRDEASKQGFVEISYRDIMVGTHFSNPSDKQVHRRFLMRGIKERRNFTGRAYTSITLLDSLKKLFADTQNRQYLLAVKAYQQGLEITREEDYDIDFGENEYREAIQNGKEL